MKTITKCAAVAAAAGALSLCVPESGAWDRYSTNGENNCAGCHGDFRATNYVSLSDGQDWGNLHNLHRFDMLSGDCATCHQEESFFPVFLDDSEGGTGFESIGCTGCHGRNEDDGPKSGRGAGLRQHHWSAGVEFCANCHGDADPATYTTVGEDVLPSYYFTPDDAHPDKPTDPCNANGEENYAGDPEGLDNDGDAAYDGDDDDCGGMECMPAPDGDVDFNGVTNFDDLLVVLSLWGTAGPDGDADCDGDVDFDDLLLVLSGWD
jgi:hypothetical protein